MIETIKKRIEENRTELAVLQRGHDAMVATFNRQQDEFNERVRQNQNRFQQIAGAIAELELLLNHVENGPEEILAYGADNGQRHASAGPHNSEG